MTPRSNILAHATAFILLGLLLSLMFGCTSKPLEPFSGKVCFNLYVPATPAEMPSACRENGWVACYIGRTNSVWIPGKRSVGEYIYLQDNILGHEVKHVLNREFPTRFENPDDPEKYLTNF